MQSTSCKMPGQMKHRPESGLLGEISITSDMQITSDKWRGMKDPLDESERGECKSWLKIQQSKNEDHGIWSHHFMANRWGKMETVRDLTFLCSKISAYGDCSHEIKRHLLLGKKSYDKPRQNIKSRDINLLTNILTVKSMVFLIVMCRYENWTIKKGEC